MYTLLHVCFQTTNGAYCSFALCTRYPECIFTSTSNRCECLERTLCLTPMGVDITTLSAGYGMLPSANELSSSTIPAPPAQWQTLGLTIAEGPTELRAPGPRDPTIRHWCRMILTFGMGSQDPRITGGLTTYVLSVSVVSH